MTDTLVDGAARTSLLSEKTSLAGSVGPATTVSFGPSEAPSTT
jgi:hypothetical protein